jgi:alpha-D-xyloside xylohydrolase
MAVDLPLPGTGHPVVDRLDTRALDGREIVRTLVHHAEVAETGRAHVVLRTTARAARLVAPFGLAAGDRAAHAPDGVSLPADGDLLPGAYRIDVVAGGTVRLRYAEGDAVPENTTAMLVGELGLPDSVRVEASRHEVNLETDEMLVRVELRPLRVVVHDRDGNVLTVIGGPEANSWSLWDAYNTGIQRAAESGRPIATETFGLRPGECIYGFGEQFLGLDKVGQTIDVNMVESMGTTTPRSYKNVPFFVSSHGYGVFVNHSCRITAWVGSRSAAAVQLGLEDDFYDLFVIAGDIKTVLGRYTDLTGKPGLPPRWSFGFWQSKISYTSADETLAITERLREKELPFDVVHLDTHWFARDWFCDLEFSKERFPDPARYMARMAKLGAKLCLWQLPYIPEPSRLFDELEAAGGFVRRDDGSVYDVAICYTPGWEGGRVGIIDFTNPVAVEIYQRHLNRLFELGAKAIKVDFGEQAPLDGAYHDGVPGHRQHNLYPLLYNKAVYEATGRGTGEALIWARSAWAGSQRYPLHWGGDSSSNWENLVPQLCGGLSFGLSGFPFWSQDIGGFLGRPDRELLIRWLQIGLFGSHARIHGFGDRELDSWDDEVTDIARRYLELRYRLLPYIWGSARDAAARSLPMLRPLVVEFQDDPNTWRIADQWMFGAALLVAPITDPTRRRRVYLPAGEWAEWWTGEIVSGGADGRWIDVEAPLDVLPLWQRAGTVVPLGPIMQYVDERPIDELVVRCVPVAAGGVGESFTFPVDDDANHDVSIAWSEGGAVPSVPVVSAQNCVVTFETSGAGGWHSGS